MLVRFTCPTFRATCSALGLGASPLLSASHSIFERGTSALLMVDYAIVLGWGVGPLLDVNHSMRLRGSRLFSPGRVAIVARLGRYFGGWLFLGPDPD